MAALKFLCLCSMFTARVHAMEYLIDLTYTYTNATLTWPSEQSERFRFTKRQKFDAPHYEANSFAVGEHTGTHIDAPRHFAAGKYGVAKIPLSDLVGKSVVINVEKKAKKNSDLLIGLDDFREHEKLFGRIPDNVIVLLHSGWGKYWPNATAYLGTDTNNTAILHFPGLDPAGATWLTQNRKIKSIGIDTASIDYGQSKTFRSHQILMEKNIPVFENVANLNLIPSTGAMVYALPMKIGEGTGAPVRIIATWDDAKSPGSSASRLAISDIAFIVYLLLFFFSILTAECIV